MTSSVLQAPVFVDPTGRRVAFGRRLMALVCVGAVTFVVAVLAAIVVVGHPSDCAGLLVRTSSTAVAGCRP